LPSNVMLLSWPRSSLQWLGVTADTSMVGRAGAGGTDRLAREGGVVPGRQRERVRAQSSPVSCVGLAQRRVRSENIDVRSGHPER